MPSKKKVSISETKVESELKTDTPVKTRKKRTPKAPVVSDLPITTDTPEPQTPKPRKSRKLKVLTETDKTKAPKKKKTQSNKWIKHVKEFHAANPTITYREAMVQAKTTYVK